jgi:hypothetical protein
VGRALPARAGTPSKPDPPIKDDE